MAPNFPSGLFQVAVLTTIIAVGVVGTVLTRITPRPRAWLLVLIAVELPMCWLALYHVRPGWEQLLKAALSANAYPWARSLSAPVTEELAKAWPLVFIAVAGYLKKLPPVAIGMALGAGFGLGEIWTVASLQATNPALAQVPWYDLGGFLFERMGVCFAHSAFTTTLVILAVRGKPLMGILAAMALHWALNFPIFIVYRFVPAPYRSTILLLWTVGYFFAMMTLLVWYHSGKLDLGRVIFGEATCPSCGVTYGRPLLGINLGPRRYEPCGACHRWHWV